jgi:flagellar assembly protein FliH
MLAKLIPANGVQALAAVEWRPGEAREEGRPVISEAAEPHPADSGHARSEVLALKAELEMVRAGAEHRLQEAFAAARREAEQSARQHFEQQIDAEVGKLRHMIRDVVSSGAKLRRQTEEDLVRLTVAIARRILHRELSVDPEALTGLVKAAFQRLDQREIHELRTDPAGVPVARKVAEGLGLAQLKIVADPALQPGSLLIGTTRGHLDASIESQLNEIERGFIDIVHHS